MKIYIDSADIDEIREAYSYGIIDGVTTNPSLIKTAVQKHGAQNLKKYLQELLIVAKGTPVSMEITELTYENMVEEAEKLYHLFNRVAGNVVIKIPIHTSMESMANTDGLRAIRYLSKKGIPINCTLIFTPEQALLAAKAGATYISPFAGRIDDQLRKTQGLPFAKTDYFPAEGMEAQGRIVQDNGVLSGVDLIEQCVSLMNRHKLQAQVLAASLRNPRQVREAALVGAHIATLPYGVITELLNHEKTTEGIKQFTADIVPEYQELR